MSSLVVDASVAVKWLLREVHSDAARRLLTVPHSLQAPDLLFSEVGNVLWKNVRRGELTLEEAEAAVDTLDAQPLEVHPARTMVPDALRIASETDRTVYDSLYLALAVERDCRLVTADRRFYNALQGGPYAGRVLWVEDES